jgi:hypothetical protein
MERPPIEEIDNNISMRNEYWFLQVRKYALDLESRLSEAKKTITIMKAALQGISEDHYPWHGEDALNMRDIANEALNIIATKEIS